MCHKFTTVIKDRYYSITANQSNSQNSKQHVRAYPRRKMSLFTSIMACLVLKYQSPKIQVIPTPPHFPLLFFWLPLPPLPLSVPPGDKLLHVLQTNFAPLSSPSFLHSLISAANFWGTSSVNWAHPSNVFQYVIYLSKTNKWKVYLVNYSQSFLVVKKLNKFICNVLSFPSYKAI